MSKIALVTCEVLPEADHDADLLLQRCHTVGLDAAYVAWDDPEVDWSLFAMAVIRSTWNSHVRHKDFREWISRTAEVTTLLNPAPLLQRTLHKSYLLELEAKCFPIVPTRIVPQSFENGSSSRRPVSAAEIANEAGWSDFVIKPAISASSYLTGRFSASVFPEAEAHLRQVLAHSDAMIQPFLHRIAEGGETSIICIDNEITHAVVKQPRFHDGHESVSSTVQPSPRQSELARDILSTIDEPWLYARIDLMQLDDSEWVLSELEVIEPSLFLIQNPAAADRLANGIKKRLSNHFETSGEKFGAIVSK